MRSRLALFSLQAINLQRMLKDSAALVVAKLRKEGEGFKRPAPDGFLREALIPWSTNSKLLSMSGGKSLAFSFAVSVPPSTRSHRSL